MKKVIIKQDPNVIVSVEVLAESIKGIAAGVRKLMSGPLKLDTIALLIQKAAPNVGGKYGQAPISLVEIRGVIEGIENLENTHLKSTKP